MFVLVTSFYLFFKFCVTLYCILLYCTAFVANNYINAAETAALIGRSKSLIDAVIFKCLSLHMNNCSISHRLITHAGCIAAGVR